MIYIGIDPGKKGGIAYIDEYKAATLPFSAEGLIDTMISLDMASSPKICCLEEVHALPRQGVASTFTFGEGYGYIKGVLETIGIPYQTVSPRRWKKEFGLCSDKKKSIEAFPRDKPSGLGQEQNGVGRYGGGSFDGGIREEEIMSVSTINITDSELFRRKNMTPEWREEFCERWREIQEIFRREAEREATENDYGGNEKRS